jgi:hypothetical protein
MATITDPKPSATYRFQNADDGAARARINLAELRDLRQRGVLAEDARRERPLYFDGRFLAARDLTRDQQYFLTREADLGRAAGSGVSNGLHVSAGDNPSQLVIGQGQGVTPAGELVLLPADLRVNLTDLPLAEQLSAKFGLGRIPAAPMRSRTGLFVLALRPVEYTANPIGAYPTTLTGPRTVEDGDVIEATAVTLVPWEDDGAADALTQRRARAARAIFARSGSASVASGLLPLAMLALDGNSIAWIDEAMLRRELGAERGDLPGLGFAPRALRMAHLMQYTHHLEDVTRQMNGRAFPAATQFQALPPAGPLPAGIISTSDFTQRYFPSEVDVDFSLIPEDELPALVEESLALPPIDLMDAEAVLDRTAVLVLAPVPRAQWREVLARLESRVRALRPAAPNQVAQRKPLEILMRLRLPLPIPVVTASPSDAEWARLASLPRLWYIRRRNLAYRDDLAGTPLAIAGRDERVVEQNVRERVAGLGLNSALGKVLAASTPQAASRVMNLLASPRIAASPTLTAATLGALTARSGQNSDKSGASTLDHATVLGVASDLARAGDGLTRIERSAGSRMTPAALKTMAAGDAWRRLDSEAMAATDMQIPALAETVAPHPAIAQHPAAKHPAVKHTATKKPVAKKPAAGKRAH